VNRCQTCSKGAQLRDPKKPFNAAPLDSNTVRGIDVRDGEPVVDATALKALILEAVGLNKSNAHQPQATEHEGYHS
jgi:hypothetical protein